MPFFQNLSKRVSEAAKEVTKRTAEATEVVKLNGRQAAVQDEIERLFNQIGKAYYAMRNASGDSEAAKALCAQVDKLQKESESIKAELDRIRNLRRCPNCGEIQANSAQFCASCGTRMPMVEAAEPEAESEAATEMHAREPVSATRSASEAPDVTIDWPKPDALEAAPEPEAASADAEIAAEIAPAIEAADKDAPKPAAKQAAKRAKDK